MELEMDLYRQIDRYTCSTSSVLIRTTFSFIQCSAVQCSAEAVNCIKRCLLKSQPTGFHTNITASLMMHRQQQQQHSYTEQ